MLPAVAQALLRLGPATDGCSAGTADASPDTGPTAPLLDHRPPLNTDTPAISWTSPVFIPTALVHDRSTDD